MIGKRTLVELEDISECFRHRGRNTRPNPAPLAELSVVKMQLQRDTLLLNAAPYLVSRRSSTPLRFRVQDLRFTYGVGFRISGLGLGGLGGARGKMGSCLTP